MERSDAGISWMDETKLADLDFADVIALLEESVYSIQHSTSVLEEEASRVGLCINPDKCKMMVSGTWSGTTDRALQWKVSTSLAIWAATYLRMATVKRT